MFKQGDKAVCTLNDQEVEIQFGPVKNSVGNDSYLVKFPHGTSSQVWVEDLEPAPRFTVGQKVLWAGLVHTVAGGPFEGATQPFYVLEGFQGKHVVELEDYLAPVVE
ncbi:hypothetical protein [Streptomyces mutomycini]|uniref:hypothetical protein n=1 Tax=Streptomyces mutomycini TaxID=284036 RepID=UPI0033F3FCA2